MFYQFYNKVITINMQFKLIKSDWIVFLFYVIASAILYYFGTDEDDGLVETYTDFVRYIGLNAISTYLMVFHLFPRFMPQKRYFLFFVVLVLFLYVIGTIWIVYECYFFNCKETPWSFKYINYGFSNHIEEVGMLATIMLGKKMFDLQLKVANMEKERKTAELSFLKAQIDPHFLFNNLNTVDALIDKDPQSAKAYLHKLGQLYRYLVSSKDQDVVPLEEELDFAKNYIYLIEERFGTAYKFEIQIEHTNPNELWVPPGALQTLLENIVKHNHGSPSEPIQTTILITEDQISVANTKRKKKSVVDSTGTGLQNLKTRYKLLTDKGIKIQSGERFSVYLPNIKLVS
ncbi:MAG: two-component system LytT family sensor kinase [Patescibacteria group bacterium]|jgi:two-component system LytT family sensor kinase